MKFYSVEEDYIRHLRSVDDKVRLSKGTRPYIGVVLTINEIDYLAPLTSYSEDKREKFESIPENSLLSFKMYELGNEDNRLGMVQLNNMIPVLDSEIALIDISILEKQDEKYANLLNIQQQYLRKNQEDLQKRAKKLYGAVNAQKAGKSKVNFMGNMSCDFKALEGAMAIYQKPQPQPVSQDKLSTLVERFKS